MNTNSIFRMSELALVIGCVSVTGCASEPKADPIVSNGSVHEVRSSLARSTVDVPDEIFSGLRRGNTAFALDLLNAVADSSTGAGQNLIYSPNSISTALAMLHGGARGETATEIKDALRLEMEAAQIYPAFNTLDRRIKAANTEDAFVETSNALWVDRSFEPAPPYVDLLGTQFGAPLYLADFANAPEDSRLAINALVAEHTHDRIPELFDEGTISSDSRLVLTNAVYLDAKWENKFPEASHGEFVLEDGSTVTGDVMTGEIAASFADTEDLLSVAIPYKGDDLEFVALMPRTGTLREFERSLTSESLEAVFASLEASSGTVSLPKFETDTSIDLNDTLQSLGIHSAFGDGEVDLSGLGAAAQSFVVSKVVHKANISVFEGGTIASAATGVNVEDTSVPFLAAQLDHPFLYLIRSKGTGAILFIGHVVNPWAS